MLIQKKYTINITNRNKGHFEKLGYTIDSNSLEIDVNDLSIGSHLKVDIQCDICKSTFTRAYKQYLRYLEKYSYDTCNKCKYHKTEQTNLEKYGVKNPFQSEEIKEKIKESNLEKYGVDNPAKSQDIQDKIKQTNLEKYGVEYHLSLPKIREKISDTKSNMGIQLPTEMIDDFIIYRNKVNALTRLVKDKLYNNWDGYDYYDKEYIKDNMNLHFNNRLYPTIDHKISVLNGFLNGVSPDEISKLENLCITKRFINASKCGKNESEYKLR